MTLTLHTNPMSRGRIVRWMLEEVGEPYEAVIVDFGPPMKGPDYLGLNPMGKVPTLVHDGAVVTEVAAILGYLAEAFPAAGLMPADRAGFWRWMFFGAGPLEYAITNKSLGFEVPADRRGTIGYGSFEDVVRVLADHLGSRAFACGDAFSVVDVMLGSQVGFGLRFGTLPAEAAFTAYHDRLKDRPAAIRASAIDDALLAARAPVHA